MHRIHPSRSYDLLHGIHFPANISSIFAYLSYFPPPPPLIPGPPPQRSWTCSAYSLSSSSCFVSDDLNPPSLRTYVPLIASNQSSSIKNTSPLTKIAHQNSKISPLLHFLQSHLTVILLSIIFLCILIFVILFFVLLHYLQRTRQRRLTTSVHLRPDETNFELNNHHQHNANKNKNFYYHLLPYREKSTTTTTLRKSTDEANRLRSINHDASAVEVRRSTRSSGTHQNADEEQEEAL